MFEIKKFLFSNKNMTGLAGAMLIIVLALLGVVKFMWIPLAVMAYVFGYLIGPKERGVVFYHVSGQSLEDYIGFLGRVEKSMFASERIPEEAKKIVEEIVGTAKELMVFLKGKDSINLQDEDMVSLKSIFDSYLPKLLTKYERLPKSYAERGRGDGSITPRSMLVEQLRMLNSKVKEIAYGLYEEDVTALRVNERFIKERFKNAENFMEAVKSKGA